MTAKVYGKKANFCGEACQEGFRTDRRYGLIYPSYNVDGKIMGVEEASIEAGFCAYCDSEV